MRRSNNYDFILRDAEIKKKQQLNIITEKCCPNCVNCGKDCLNLEHALTNGAEVYRCLNYLKCSESGTNKKNIENIDLQKK